MGFCSESIGFLLFLSNLIFSFVGIILIGVGFWVMSDLKPYTDFLKTSEDLQMLEKGGYMLIGVGCFIALVYVIGCVGACTKKPCVLYSFASALILLFIVEVGISVSLFMFSGEAKGAIDKFMKESMAIYNKGELPNGYAITEGLDKIQKQFECCGFDGYEDWKPILNDTNKIAPKSCCEKEGYCIMSITSSKVYKKGCGKMFEEWLEEHVTLAGGFIIGIAVLQLFSIVVALVFARQKKNETV